MRLRLILFHLLLGLSITAMADDRITFLTCTASNGKSTCYSISKENLAKLPEWKVDEPLPLPIQETVSKATEWIKAGKTKLTEWNIISIQLGRIYDSDIKNRWYYSIAVGGTIDINGTPAYSRFDVIALMDGTIVEPRNKE